MHDARDSATYECAHAHLTSLRFVRQTSFAPSNMRCKRSLPSEAKRSEMRVSAFSLSNIYIIYAR